MSNDLVSVRREGYQSLEKGVEKGNVTEHALGHISLLLHRIERPQAMNEIDSQRKEHQSICLMG
jgi:hypothetical protein